jgi:hypothetical protein
MNQHTLSSFGDELIKISKIRTLVGLKGLLPRPRPALSGWSAGAKELAATRGLGGQRTVEMLSKQAPQSQLQRTIAAQEKAVAKQMASTAGRSDAEILAAIKSGKLDPKVHSIDTFRSTGEIVSRPTRAAPSLRMTPAQREAGTMIGGKVTPPNLLAKLRGRYEGLPGRARQILGGGALATAGLGGGLGVGQAVD